MIDIDELERLARAALVKEPTPWTGVEDEVHGPPDDNVPPGYDPTNRVASGIYFIETRDYIATANPAVVLELVRRLRAAEAAANDPELRRWAVNHIKTRFAQWRTPPVETPADSWTDEVVGEILRRATEFVK